jgi:hypothetical protein
MDMILLDWTRMGKSYCLAGVVAGEDGCRVVRPLLTKFRHAPVRNVGWSAYLLDGHSRWEVFELVGAATAAPEPPHLEDVWVRGLRPRKYLAPVEQRRAILQATAVWPGETAFGEPLEFTRVSAFLLPGHGRRSLTTLTVPSGQVVFSASRREGTDAPDVRVALCMPPLGERLFPFKDHHLLLMAEQAGRTLTEQVQALNQAVRRMGDQVAVRLGLSRPFPSGAESGEAKCWLMVDGIFSLADPQP